MKSMSWLLYENESSVLWECRACGFSTHSPSIYRRHSRHCSRQPPSQSSVANDSPNVSSECSAGFSEVYSDFPVVSSEHSEGFPDISSPTLVSDKLLAAETSNRDKADVVSSVKQTVSLESRQDRSGLLVETLIGEVGSNLAPGNTSCSGDILHFQPASSCDPDNVDSAEACLKEGDVMWSSPQLDSASSVVDDTNRLHPSDVFENRSHSASPVDARTPDMPDMMKVDSKVVDGSETENESELMTVVENTAMTKDTSMELKIRTPSKKSPRRKTVKNVSTTDDSGASTFAESTCRKVPKKKYSGRKFSPLSSQRRCEHCRVVLSSRIERRTHMQMKHPDKIPVFRCPDCSYRSIERKNYKRHLQMKHPDKIPLFRCPDCSYCSIERKNYERHLLRHLLAGPFCCDKCSFSSTSQSSIKRHVTLQHKTAADSDGTAGSTEVETPVMEILPSGVDDLKSEEILDQISATDVPLDSNNSEKQQDEGSNDVAASGKDGCRNIDSAENSVGTKINAEKSAMPETSGDKMIKVEVKTCPGENGGEDETWWTCLACSARYNQRAKVRRHVKSKHQVALTKCQVIDYRPTPPPPPTQNSPGTFAAAIELIRQLREARLVAKSQAAASSDKPSEQQKTGLEPSSGVKFQSKTFVKIAPKPLQLDATATCQTPATIVMNPKRQVVLPKCSWKQMSMVSLQLPCSGIVESASSVVKDSDAGSSSDIARTEPRPSSADKEESFLPSAAQQFAEKNNDASGATDPSSSLILESLDFPKKKRRLILRAKYTGKVLQEEPCSSVLTESSNTDKDTNSNLALSSIQSLEPNEQCSEGDNITSAKPTDETLEPSDENLARTPEKQRPLGLKRTSPLKCAHCRFTSYRLPDLRRHLLEHTGDKLYECEKCSRSFQNKIGLYLHEQRKHKANGTDMSGEPAPNENAPMETDTAEQISTTEAEKIDVNNAEEPKPKKKRMRKSSLDSQLKGKPDKQISADAAKTADDAGCVAKSGSDEKISRKKKRKRCTETVEMVQSTDKSDHFKIVIRRKSGVGDEEILETIDGVNNEMMCKYCGYTAKIPIQLKQHMKIHTGERDYWCTVGDCSYGTIWRCDMKRHFQKFHPEEVERQDGNCYDLLQRSYQPGKLKNDAPSDLPLAVATTESSSPSEMVRVLKMSKRQRRRLLKLRNSIPEHSGLSEKEAASVESEPRTRARSVKSMSSDVPGCTGELASAAGSKKTQFKPESVERFRPYKCSECGRRSNWRFDLKKHIHSEHKHAVIIKLNEDVARATFDDIYSSRGGKNGIRLSRHEAVNPQKSSNNGNFDAEESSGDGKKPVSELERALASAPTVAKSIGMIDTLQLKRFQCSGCLYRSNHRGDLGRHIRMRHGRGNCTISILGADVAASTLHAYRRQWNRKKARWSKPVTDVSSVDTGKTLPPKLRRQTRGRSAEVEETEEKVEVGESCEKSVAESEHFANGKHAYKDFFYPDDENDETKCCDICPFKTDRTGLLELHKLRHRAPPAAAGSMTYSCPHCPYFVRSSRQLERHMALHEDPVQPHNGEPSPEIIAGIQLFSCSGPGKTRYVCERCPFVSMYRNEFWLHRRHHFVPRVDIQYSCDMCPFWAADRRTMAEHLALHMQGFYPRLSVPIVSRYQTPPNVKENNRKKAHGNDGENHHDEVLSQPKVMVDVDTQIQKSISSVGGDSSMEVEGCAQLKAGEENLPSKIDDNLAHGTSEITTPGEVTSANILQAEMVPDVETQSEKIIGGDLDMEVEECPQLEAVDQTLAAVSDYEVSESCPLLEPECEPSAVEPSSLSEAVPCTTLCVYTAVLKPSSVAAGGNLVASESDEALAMVDNNLSDSTSADLKASTSDDTDLMDFDSEITVPVCTEVALLKLSFEAVERDMVDSDVADMVDAVFSKSMIESSSEMPTGGDLKAVTSTTGLPLSAELSSITAPVSSDEALSRVITGVDDGKVAENCKSGELEVNSEITSLPYDGDSSSKGELEAAPGSPSDGTCTYLADTKFESGHSEAEVEISNNPIADVGQSSDSDKGRSRDDGACTCSTGFCACRGLQENTELSDNLSPVARRILRNVEASASGTDAGGRVQSLESPYAVAEAPPKELHVVFEVCDFPTLDASSASLNGRKIESEYNPSIADIGEKHSRVERSSTTDGACTCSADQSAGEVSNNARVELEVETSLTDGVCSCSLQCPYCFFAIASVHLLRQHIVFHVAMSDAVRIPVFQPRLNGVQDGRMDDLRCADLVQPCSRCRRLANLGDPKRPETSSISVGSGNHDLENFVDQMTQEDKVAFLSRLSLGAS